ncbi:MAG: hypothetical protein SOZ23_01805 [Methanosphaera sp.]|uniref:hypothetical protein n=1 Tax=Methanosphaera sp. TaxID=2666342 RepID=UPI0025E08B1E|nr:hypothetical protein [Methanosphaera sp.]MCI5866599.1 hypothetical protein [Methanosphaera sp.]MDD6535079.1 hypothetical protein [Methanosphaera sp.]MDY3955511.1 hypothetical protein [Methanosphaera sp.]
MYKKLIVISIMSVMLLSTLSSVCALEEITQWEVTPGELTFQYSDENTSVYKGDMGLKRLIIKDSNSNHTYSVVDSNVRALAKYTHRSFKFKGPIYVDGHKNTNDELGFEYFTTAIYDADHNKLRRLEVYDDDLTAEEKSYFDDYEQQRQEHDDKQQQYALEDIEDQSRRSSDRHRSGMAIGTHGVSYYRSF